MPMTRRPRLRDEAAPDGCAGSFRSFAVIVSIRKEPPAIGKFSLPTGRLRFRLWIAP
jgi:hypothetical protein